LPLFCPLSQAMSAAVAPAPLCIVQSGGSPSFRWAGRGDVVSAGGQASTSQAQVCHAGGVAPLVGAEASTAQPAEQASSEPSARSKNKFKKLRETFERRLDAVEELVEETFAGVQADVPGALVAGQQPAAMGAPPKLLRQDKHDSAALMQQQQRREAPGSSPFDSLQRLSDESLPQAEAWEVMQVRIGALVDERLKAWRTARSPDDSGVRSTVEQTLNLVADSSCMCLGMATQVQDAGEPPCYALPRVDALLEERFGEFRAEWKAALEEERMRSNEQARALRQRIDDELECTSIIPHVVATVMDELHESLEEWVAAIEGRVCAAEEAARSCQASKSTAAEEVSGTCGSECGPASQAGQRPDAAFLELVGSMDSSTVCISDLHMRLQELSPVDVQVTQGQLPASQEVVAQVRTQPSEAPGEAAVGQQPHAAGEDPKLTLPARLHAVELDLASIKSEVGIRAAALGGRPGGQSVGRELGADTPEVNPCTAAQEHQAVDRRLASIKDAVEDVQRRLSGGCPGSGARRRELPAMTCGSSQASAGKTDGELQPDPLVGTAKASEADLRRVPADSQAAEAPAPAAQRVQELQVLHPAPAKGPEPVRHISRGTGDNLRSTWQSLPGHRSDETAQVFVSGGANLQLACQVWRPAQAGASTLNGQKWSPLPAYHAVSRQTSVPGLVVAPCLTNMQTKCSAVLKQACPESLTSALPSARPTVCQPAAKPLPSAWSQHWGPTEGSDTPASRDAKLSQASAVASEVLAMALQMDSRPEAKLEAAHGAAPERSSELAWWPAATAAVEATRSARGPAPALGAAEEVQASALAPPGTKRGGALRRQASAPLLPLGGSPAATRPEQGHRSGRTSLPAPRCPTSTEVDALTYRSGTVICPPSTARGTKCPGSPPPWLRCWH